MRVVLVAMLLAVSSVAVTAEDYTVFEDFEWKSDDAITEIELGNVTGDITVTTGPGPVSITAELAAVSEEYLAGMSVDVEKTGGSAKVTTVLPEEDERDTNTGRVDYTITLPADAAIMIDAVNGDITVTGIKTAAIKVVNGDVALTDVYESTLVRSTNGKVTIDNKNGETKNIHCELVNGDAEVVFCILESGGDYRVDCISGNITVDLIGGAKNLSFEGVTVAGEVTTDFPLIADNGLIAHAYTAVLGDGSNWLRLSSLTGETVVNTK